MLLVGGTFDNDKGKYSFIVDELSKFLKCETVNGGNIQDLYDINYKDLDVLIWMPNISNDEIKILPRIKKENPHLLLIQSKRVIEKEYTESDVVGRMLASRSLLGIMITKDQNYRYKLLDPLGNQYCDTDDIKILANSIDKRVKYIKSLSRKGSIKAGEVRDFDIPEEFIKIVRESGEQFSNFVNAVNPNRLLGNASTRCSFGFPAANIKDRIFVTRRNVDKCSLSDSDFVEVYRGDNVIYYYGDNKPSVDTPVQVELFKRYPNIKYMIHGHVYVDRALITDNKIPCGFLEEVDDILSVIPDTNVNEFAVNLKGHGCLIACDDLSYFDRIKFVGRIFPETD